MPIAITVRARKTRVRLPSLRSTSPIHARSPSSDIAPIYPLVENRAGGAGQIPCGPHFPPPEPRRARMPEAVIVDTIRTPIGRAFKGSLAGLRPDEMGAYVVDQLLERNPEVDPAEVEDLFCGCGMPQGLQAFNIGRIVSLLSEKLPQEVNGVTVSRYCSSSLDAIRHAGNAIKAGVADRVEAGGAVAGDGDAVDLLRQLLREQADGPPDVEGLQALRHAAAAEEVFDRGRIDLGVALEQPVDDEGAHLVGAQLGQRALEGAADRRADGVDDDCLGHAGVSLG